MSSLRGCLAIAQAAPAFGQPCGPLLVDTGLGERLYLFDARDGWVGFRRE